MRNVFFYQRRTFAACQLGPAGLLAPHCQEPTTSGDIAVALKHERVVLWPARSGDQFNVVNRRAEK